MLGRPIPEKIFAKITPTTMDTRLNIAEANDGIKNFPQAFKIAMKPAAKATKGKNGIMILVMATVSSNLPGVALNALA